MPKDQGYFPQRRDGQNVDPYAGRDVSLRGPGARTSPSRKAEMARPELLDVGPIGQAYEQWSKGDLMSRAQQLGIHGALTHEQMIERIREEESRPKRKAPSRKTSAARSARSGTKSRTTAHGTARANGTKKTTPAKAKAPTTKRKKATSEKTKVTPTKRAPAKTAATTARKKTTSTATTRKRPAASPKARGTRASAQSMR